MLFHSEYLGTKTLRRGKYYESEPFLKGKLKNGLLDSCRRRAAEEEEKEERGAGGTLFFPFFPPTHLVRKLIFRHSLKHSPHKKAGGWGGGGVTKRSKKV